MSISAGSKIWPGKSGILLTFLVLSSSAVRSPNTLLISGTSWGSMLESIFVTHM